MASRTTSRTKKRTQATESQLSLFGAPPAASEPVPPPAAAARPAPKAPAPAAKAPAPAAKAQKPAPQPSKPEKTVAKPVEYDAAPQTFALGALTLTLATGNLAATRADALVNAANPALAIAGGVDRALRRAGGRAYLDALEELQEDSGGCRVGDAMLSAAGALEAEMVVHVVSPRWRGGTRGEPELLERALASGLAAAGQAGARSVALPAMGTGAYGVPHDVSAAVTLRVLADTGATVGLETATVVLKDAAALAAWLEVARGIGLEPAGR